MNRAVRLGFVVAFAVAGCGDDDGMADPDASMTEGCTRDVECDDGLYCNGTERCAPGDPSATELGCIAGDVPCAESCNEADDRCLEGCPDNDGDGAADITCGGEDCDDSDANRYPSNTEVCDSEGLDEDCDPSTLGNDADDDGFVDDECCNLQRDGALLCGTDCDDTSMAINPEAIDTCGNGDEDCDGDIDEDPDLRFYRDADMDTYGLTGESVLACSAPDDTYAVRDGDCDDANDTINPGESERCDASMRDDDCDGTANEDCGCSPTGTSRACGTSDVGECSLGTQTCLPSGDGGSVWGACSGNTEPESESCNAVDDDCDGTPDDGFDCVRGTVESGTNDCGRAASRTCNSSCVWNPPTFGTAETTATCDYCDDSGLGLSQELPYASDSQTYPFETTPVTRYSAPCSSPCIHLTGSPGNTNDEGAGYLTDAVEIGYGNVVYDMTMEVRPNLADIGDGWALVLFVDGVGTEFLGPGGLALGVPTDRDGFAVEWRFSEPDGSNRQTTDSLVFRHLRFSASDPVIASTLSAQPQAFDSSSSTLKWFQRLRATITPDIAGDAANDTAVVIEYFHSGSWQSAFACGSGTACPFILEAGSSIRAGVTGASRNGHEAQMFVDMSETFLSVSSRCP